MNIDTTKLLRLWCTNADGKVYPLPDGPVTEAVPEEYEYYHSRFPLQIEEHVHRIVRQKDVDACNHPEDRIEATGGWIEGFEGRKCKKCHGTQSKKVEDEWPEVWDSDEMIRIFVGMTSVHEPLALALATKRLTHRRDPFSLSDSLLIAAIACERCLNALIFEYGLEGGYREFSKSWHAANTSCQFCEHYNTEEEQAKLPHYPDDRVDIKVVPTPNSEPVSFSLKGASGPKSST
jgi:hypothetical protein